jgi:hypothetical protein
MATLTRGERLQIMLSDEELAALDDFRFRHRMPSRAAAVRQILKQGLGAHSVNAPVNAKSRDIGILGERKRPKRAPKMAEGESA